jgi:GNAT superfamily N-acetyltransferase
MQLKATDMVLIVQIVDPGVPGITRPEVVAVLNLDSSNLPNTVQVGSITVDEDYRGRGLAQVPVRHCVDHHAKESCERVIGQTPGGRTKLVESGQQYLALKCRAWCESPTKSLTWNGLPQSPRNGGNTLIEPWTR